MMSSTPEMEEPPRFAEERRARIVKALREHGRMEVLALARLFDVSEHTIRRDLKQLHEQGMLQKTHGGAVMLDNTRLGFDARAALLPQTKDAIGRAAATLVEAGSTVILDAGSTTLALARALKARPITVITNSLDIAAVLDRDPAVQLIVTGGMWQSEARALRGTAARELLATCRADLAVLGACALDVRAGVTVADEDDAAIKRTMLAQAARTIVLADRSKQHTIAPFQVATWDRVHTLVTDAPWPELTSLGVSIHQVPSA